MTTEAIQVSLKEAADEQNPKNVASVNEPEYGSGVVATTKFQEDEFIMNVHRTEQSIQGKIVIIYKYCNKNPGIFSVCATPPPPPPPASTLCAPRYKACAIT